jgi:hypothetical protein
LRRSFSARSLQKIGDQKAAAAETNARMSGIGQIFWLLVYGVAEATHTFFPPSPLPKQRLALGKSYPVTAAQLLPVSTGFLAPIRLITPKSFGVKLAKNWS